MCRKGDQVNTADAESPGSVRPSQDLNIRPLHSEDEALLDDMLYLALWVPEGQAPFPRAITRSPDLHRYISAWGSLPEDSGFVAEASPDSPLAVIWLRCIPAPGGYGFISACVPELSMAVIPSARNQGLGSRLLTVALESAQSSFPAVSLSVAPSNPALHLYQRFGFVECERRGGSLVMAKAFEPLEKAALRR